MDTDFTQLFLYHSLIATSEILIIIALIHMLYKRRTPTSMLAWLFSMILVPYVAVAFYFIFGNRKRKNKYKKNNLVLQSTSEEKVLKNPVKKLLKNYNIPNIYTNEYLKLYTDSNEAFEIFLDSIRNAKESIYISTYVFKYDKITKQIIDELIKKSNEGVEVKILLDTIGSIVLYLSQYRLKKLKDAGVEVEFFMPILRMPFRNYINLRNHRKIYIFDDQKVLSGGMNLSKEYFGKSINRQVYEDMLFLIEGKSVKSYFDVFKSDWLYASHVELKFKQNTSTTNQNASIQVVPSGPDVPNDALYEALLCAIYNAKKRIWIVTPYFIPDNSLMQGLKIARQKGLEVMIITPKKSNHILADLTRSSYLDELEDSNIKVNLYNGSMLHAKAILFDNSIAMIGSVNIDNRSLFLNYEIATFVYSKDDINQIELWMKKLVSNSTQDRQKVSTPRRVMQNLMRILAPIL